MKKLSPIQIFQLDAVGKKYNCELFFPPFYKSLNLFYCMNDIAFESIRLRKFLMEVKDAEVDFNFRNIDGNSYMEIIGSS